MLLVFVLFLGACSSSPSPGDVVELYLSATSDQESEEALKRWELHEVGAAFVTLGVEQEMVRMDARRILASDVTTVLGMAGKRLSWVQQDASYYDITKGVPLVVDGPGKAGLSTVEIKLMIERVGQARLKETLAFNLWKSPNKGWKITGLDKGLRVLEPFLDEVRMSQ